MKNIEASLNKFLAPWRRKSGYLGAILTGSYATGTQTEFSDVDVQIVYKDGTEWRERGNKIMDGYVFEYFANPVGQYKKYMDKEYASGKRTTARMFVTGLIIEDTGNNVGVLKNEAEKMFKKKFAKISKFDAEIAKYTIWDNVDGLKDLEKRNTPDFLVLYGITLVKVFEIYAKFLGIEMPTTSKLYRFLSDRSFRENYKMAEVPDGQFVKLLMSSLKKKDLKSIEKLVKHVQSQMGGFNIDGWKLKSPIEE